MSKEIFAYNGMFSVHASDLAYAFAKNYIAEVKSYCKEQGFDVKRVVLALDNSVDVCPPTHRIHANSETRLRIEEDNGDYIAKVTLVSKLHYD